MKKWIDSDVYANVLSYISITFGEGFKIHYCIKLLEYTILHVRV